MTHPPPMKLVRGETCPAWCLGHPESNRTPITHVGKEIRIDAPRGRSAWVFVRPLVSLAYRSSDDPLVQIGAGSPGGPSTFGAIRLDLDEARALAEVSDICAPQLAIAIRATIEVIRAGGTR